MSPTRTLSVVLFLALPALAQVDPETPKERKWTVAFETVVGEQLAQPGDRGSATVVTSSLATVQYRPMKQLGVGAVVPFGLGYGTCRWLCAGYVSRTPAVYGQLGAVSLFASWEALPGPATRLHLGVLVALPTAFGAWTPYPSPRFEGQQIFAQGAALAALHTRGFEGWELLDPGFAVVPSAAVLHDLGPVELSASAKVPFRYSLVNRFNDERGAVDVVGVVQAMVKVLNRPEVVVAAGARTVALVHKLDAFALAVEPRVEARVGALSLRAGFNVPLAYGFLGQSRVDQGFPSSWGVRLGVGYGF